MRKVLALFVIIVFVTPLLLAALLILPMRTWILDRNFYYDVLGGKQLVSLLQSTTLPIETEGPMPFSQDVLDALYASLKRLITPEYLDSQLKPVIDNVLNLLEGSATTLELNLDLKPLKESMLGDKKDEMLNKLAESIPVCEKGQNLDLSQMLVVCRPVDVPVDAFIKNLLEPALQEAVKTLPDEYSFKSPENLSLDEIYFWTPLFPSMLLPNFLNLAVAVISILALLFWLLAALIADSTWRVRLMWLGGSLVIPALVVLLAGAILQFLNAGNLVNWMLSRLSQAQLGADLQAGLVNFARHLATRIALPFFISGGIALGSGIALIAWGVSIKPRA